jgi:hypothetical protein
MNKSNITAEQLNTLGFQQFEKLVFDVFRQVFKDSGIKLIHTPYNNDGGKDAEGIKSFLIGKYATDVSFWIEVKQRNKNINLTDIGKTLVLVLVQGINCLYIVSNKTFAPQAQSASKSFNFKTDKRVYLISGAEFLQMANKIKYGLRDNQSSSIISPELLNIKRCKIISAVINNSPIYSTNVHDISLKTNSNNLLYVFVEIDLFNSFTNRTDYILNCSLKPNIGIINNPNITIVSQTVGKTLKIFPLSIKPLIGGVFNATLIIKLKKDDNILAIRRLTQIIKISNSILPEITIHNQQIAVNSIKTTMVSWLKGNNYVNNILIKAEAGTGKSYLVSKIRQYLMDNEVSEIFLDGTDDKYPREILNKIFQTIFPIPFKTISGEYVEEIRDALSNSDLSLSKRIIDYIISHICETNEPLEKSDSDIHYLAEIFAYIICKMTSLGKKYVIFYEDLHKVNSSIVFFIIEAQRQIKKLKGENKVLFILTSRMSPTLLKHEQRAWFNRFEELLQKEFLQIIDLKSPNINEAIKILQCVIPGLSRLLCAKIVEQGGRTPFFLKEYLGLLLFDGIIEPSTNNLKTYLIINPLLLRKYSNEKIFTQPTYYRLQSIFNFYGKDIRALLCLAACMGKRFSLTKLLNIVKNKGSIHDGIKKCEELEIFRISTENVDEYIFDHDIIRTEILRGFSSVEHKLFAEKLLRLKGPLKVEDKLRLLYQSGQAEECYEFIRSLTNTDNYFSSLQWHHLKINLLDPSFFNRILDEYRELLLFNWDDSLYFAPQIAIKRTISERNKELLDTFLSTLNLLTKVSSGSDSLSSNIITEGLMLVQMNNTNIFLEAQFRYYLGYFLFERNLVSASIREHIKVKELLENVVNDDKLAFKARNLVRLAIGLRRIGEFESSRQILLKGLKVNSFIGDKSFYLDFRSNYAATFYYSDPSKHHRYYTRSLLLAKNYHSNHKEARIHLQLATNHFRFSEYSQSKTEFAICKDMFDNIQSFNEQIRYNLNYACYLMAAEDNLEYSEMLLKEAENLALLYNNHRRLWRIYSNLATLYEIKKNILFSFEYDSRVLNLLLLKDAESDLENYVKVLSNNREICAFINIYLRISTYPIYKKLNKEVSKILPPSFVNMIHLEMNKVNTNKLDRLKLNLQGFCKLLKSNYRFLIPE